MAALQVALAPLTFKRIVHLRAQAGVRYSIEDLHAYGQSSLVGHPTMPEVVRALRGANSVCVVRVGLWRRTACR